MAIRCRYCGEYLKSIIKEGHICGIPELNKVNWKRKITGRSGRQSREIREHIKRMIKQRLDKPNPPDIQKEIEVWKSNN